MKRQKRRFAQKNRGESVGPERLACVLPAFLLSDKGPRSRLDERKGVIMAQVLGMTNAILGSAAAAGRAAVIAAAAAMP